MSQPTTRKYPAEFKERAVKLAVESDQPIAQTARDLGVDILPGMNAGASTSAVPSPIEGSGTAWVLLGSWALSPARPTPIHPRPERRGFSAFLVNENTL